MIRIPRSLFLLSYVLIIFIACGKTKIPDGAIYQVLSPNDFEGKMSQTQDAYLIDARTPAEIETGKLTSALNYNYKADGIEKAIKELDKNKPVFIYCGSGIRSKKSAEILLKAGFTEIYDMEGGMKAWLSAGKKVE